MSDHARPEMLVTTDWVERHIGSDDVRLVEVDVDTAAYESGHIPTAVGFNWQTQLQDQVTRDVVQPAAFEKLMSAAGITPQDTIVLYGDHSNWFAAYALWLLEMYGHGAVRLMDGGRAKWVAEKRALTTDTPAPAATSYRVASTHEELRARLTDVLNTAGRVNLVDVRSPDEFTGKVIAPPGMTESAQRGGHIPGATSIPWAQAVNEDGTFKSRAELEDLYVRQGGVDPARGTIAYCRIGERSSHSWFVLKYLLGLDDVKNYDGSWTEYGSVVGVPIEQGAPQVAAHA